MSIIGRNGRIRFMVAGCVLAGVLGVPVPASAEADSLAACGGSVSLGSPQPQLCWTMFDVEDTTPVVFALEPGLGFTGRGQAMLCRRGPGSCAETRVDLEAMFVAGLADPRHTAEAGVLLAPGTWWLEVVAGDSLYTPPVGPVCTPYRPGRPPIPPFVICAGVPPGSVGMGQGGLEGVVRLSETN